MIKDVTIFCPVLVPISPLLRDIGKIQGMYNVGCIVVVKMWKTIKIGTDMVCYGNPSI